MSVWVILLTTVHLGLCAVALILGGRAVVRWSFAPFHPTRESAFLYTGLAATVTGFVFPFHGITPAIIIGLISCFTLIVTLLAGARLASKKRLWSLVFACGLLTTQYLLVFVTIAQAFTKIGALHALAPTLKEAPFALSQAVALIAFLTLTVLAIRQVLSPRRAKRC